MLLSAGSALVVLATGQFSAQERVLLDSIEKHTVKVIRDGHQIGTAVLIARTGLFVTHRSAVTAKTLNAVNYLGGFNLSVVSFDVASGLVLLQARPWRNMMDPAPVASTEPVKGEPIYGLLNSGPIRAEFVSGQRLGVVAPSRRLVMLNEIKFEAPLDKVGGATLFNSRGEFLGALNAVLDNGAQKDETQQAKAQAFGAARTMANASAGNGLAGNQQSDVNATSRGAAPQSFGPSRLTVGYTVGYSQLQYILQGFLSPSHKVIYATLGVFCKDVPGGGALVDTVVKNSEADLAGIRKGDLITAIAGSPIRNQVDFAMAMVSRTVGQTVIVVIRRAGAEMAIPVVVGADSS